MNVQYSSSNMVIHYIILPHMNPTSIPDLDPVWSLAVESIIYMLVEVLEEANGNHLSFPTYLWLLSCYDSYSCLGDVVLVMR